jgi:hypothetical protein
MKAALCVLGLVWFGCKDAPLSGKKASAEPSVNVAILREKTEQFFNSRGWKGFDAMDWSGLDAASKSGDSGVLDHLQGTLVDAISETDKLRMNPNSGHEISHRLVHLLASGAMLKSGYSAQALQRLSMAAQEKRISQPMQNRFVSFLHLCRLRWPTEEQCEARTINALAGREVAHATTAYKAKLSGQLRQVEVDLPVRLRRRKSLTPEEESSVQTFFDMYTAFLAGDLVKARSLVNTLKEHMEAHIRAEELVKLP